MELGLAGKTAIVTGGASNIGRAITLAFLAEGTNVVIADIDDQNAAKVAQLAKDQGLPGRAAPIHADVTSPEDVQGVVVFALQEFGSLDVHINNVGWTFERLFLDKPREEWEKEVNINLWGPINCFQAVLPHMVEQKKGAIVSISSDAARMGEYKEGVYAAAKAGVIALTKTLSREYGKFNVRLNCVCPGLTMPASEDERGAFSLWQGQNFTPDQQEAAAKRYPLRRLGRAKDVANAVVFLASDAADFITGQTLSASGGYTMI
jgi:2-hydroxycyclohexanecarboxyl-CoA dehydrogenase